MAAASRQVALLRGINVGRSERIAMADLRALLEELGYTDVLTHLQSGNAVFTTAEPPAQVVGSIEKAIAGALGLDVKVVVRTCEQLAEVVAANPLDDVATDPAKYLVGFPGGRIDRKGAAALSGEDFAPNVVRVVKSEVYLWCPNGVQDSPFARVDWDRRLGVPVTMRNWKTVTKLAELAAG